MFAARSGAPWDLNMQRKRRFRSLLKAFYAETCHGPEKIIAWVT